MSRTDPCQPVVEAGCSQPLPSWSYGSYAHWSSDRRLGAGPLDSFPGMRGTAPSKNREECQGAFTLLELLVVISIIGLVAGMIIPAMTSILQGTNLEQGARVVVDQISLARQIASTRNCTTQICLIKLAGVSSKGYSAMQIRTPGTTGTMTAAAKMVTLPQSIVISEDGTNLSKILPVLTDTGTMTAGGASVPYVAFSLRPSGIVVPVLSGPSRSNLYLTVVPARVADATTLPPNNAVIQINPDTGSPLVFRP